MFFLTTPSQAANKSTDIAEIDVAKIRAVNEAYASAWLKNDRTAVLRIFSNDAVLIPQGNGPVQGIDAIEKFWWPVDGPRTTIKTFTITTEEIGGQGKLGYVRGTFRFTFSYEEKGKTRDQTNVGNYLMIMKRQPNGNWLISHRMWGDLTR
jgi:uncharacterized protein (TIGR02246 family)